MTTVNSHQIFSSGNVVEVGIFIFICWYLMLADFKCVIEKMTPMCFVYSPTINKLYNQLARLSRSRLPTDYDSITIHSGRNPCSVWRPGFGIGQMHPLFGGISNRIEKIHQTKEIDDAKSHNVYTMAVKGQSFTQWAQTKKEGIENTSVIWVLRGKGELKGLVQPHLTLPKSSGI